MPIDNFAELNDFIFDGAKLISDTIGILRMIQEKEISQIVQKMMWIWKRRNLKKLRLFF